MKIAGVYYIKCLITNKYYIGSSINIKSRFNAHKRKLILQKHSNNILQNQWNKYGEQNFEFKILEEVKISEDTSNQVRLLEQKYFEDERYNIDLNCVKKVIITKDDFDQYRQSCRVYKISKETKEKISKTLKERGINQEEQQFMKKRWQEEKLLHPEKWERSEQVRKAIGERSQKEYKFIYNDEIIHVINLKQFCSDKQLHYKTMHKVTKGIRKQYKGYTKAE